MKGWPAKDPDETLDYALDWNDVLAADGDTITSATWEFPAGFALESQQEAGGVTTVWVSGGLLSSTPYRIVCRVHTSGGRTYERSVPLRVVQR